MKTLIHWSLAPALLIAASAHAETLPDPRAAEAKTIIQQFAGALQGELQDAIASGGPVRAIEVCETRAPAIADELSTRTGWSVGRTSLGVRNAARNTPDDWEREILDQFEEQRAAGEPVADLAHAEVVEDEDGRRFRFMKAIPTAEVCLACHGDHLTPEVAAALDERYPEDDARGYRAGDIRGAFTLAKPL
ncbi:Tll0287-like domain-containing protein [Marichromatium bheemlicum]|uniref:DUF3365 domain-containing protein n=1 Tax=Marichromatium bheemlicum TaxID=365339 RepID=A0ABX1I6L9_9GAMM|nr:DUF3365 domain-containing protein [Marichromatium bheemlicum]NKN31821.1 DUF3365 domain-containing protein [Marichromatium bheemlicum]